MVHEPKKLRTTVLNLLHGSLHGPSREWDNNIQGVGVLIGFVVQFVLFSCV